MKALYVDWSGDAGWKFRASSSRYLSIACVTGLTPFSDILDIVRFQYSLGKDFCFRFTDASRFIKPPFFAELASHDLAGIILRVNKSNLGAEFRKMRGTDLIGFFVAETISWMPDNLITDHWLIFDGSRKEVSVTQTMRIMVSAKLRSLGKPLFRRIVPRPAREEDGLQAADMLAGAAASEHLSDNALLGHLREKVNLKDYQEEKNLPG